MFYSLVFSLCVLVLGDKKGVMETELLYGKLRKSSANVFVAQNFYQYLEDTDLWVESSCCIYYIYCCNMYRAFCKAKFFLWILNELHTHYPFSFRSFFSFKQGSMHIMWNLPVKAYACANMHWTKRSQKAVYCINTKHTTYWFSVLINKNNCQYYEY